MKEQPITTFVAKLSRDTPTPGGGSAAAVAAALGVSSILMAAKFSLSAKKNADCRSEIEGSITRLEECKQEFLKLIDADIEAFKPLSAAYDLPKQTEEEKKERHQSIQAASLIAIQPQVSLHQHAVEAIKIASTLLPSIKKTIIGDLAVGVQLLRSAYLSSITNLYSNVQTIADPEVRERYLTMIENNQSETLERADALYEEINQTWRAKL